MTPPEEEEETQLPPIQDTSAWQSWEGDPGPGASELHQTAIHAETYGTRPDEIPPAARINTGKLAWTTVPTATEIANGDETILAEADRIINGPRNGAYGNATPAFTQYARMWSVILGVEVTAKQVALCMVGLKICRETVKPQRDNRVDACGYLGLADQIEMGTK